MSWANHTETPQSRLKQIGAAAVIFATLMALMWVFPPAHPLFPGVQIGAVIVMTPLLLIGIIITLRQIKQQNEEA